MRDTVAAPRVETSLVRAHGFAALAALFVSVAFGIFASIQLLAPDVAAGTPWLRWGASAMPTPTATLTARPSRLTARTARTPTTSSDKVRRWKKGPT